MVKVKESTIAAQAWLSAFLEKFGDYLNFDAIERDLHLPAKSLGRHRSGARRMTEGPLRDFQYFMINRIFRSMIYDGYSRDLTRFVWYEEVKGQMPTITTDHIELLQLLLEKSQIVLAQQLVSDLDTFGYITQDGLNVCSITQKGKRFLKSRT